MFRLILILVLAAAVSGCATTSNRSESEQLQSRVTDLEKKMEAKDSQVVDLQYQVKDISSKVESSPSNASPSTPSASESTTETENIKSKSKTSEKSSIIRVKVSAQDVQTALKAAGVYTGPIDGKIGAATKSAIIEFQKGHGLKADGILGKKTWEELKGYLKS